jgi:hypothetical protein
MGLLDSPFVPLFLGPSMKIGSVDKKRLFKPASNWIRGEIYEEL